MLTFQSAHFVSSGSSALSCDTITKIFVILGLLDTKMLLNVTSLCR